MLSCTPAKTFTFKDAYILIRQLKMDIKIQMRWFCGLTEVPCEVTLCNVEKG